MTSIEQEQVAAGPAGFDHDGTFVRFRFSDQGKDLLLIDRVTGGMPLDEFYDAVNDPAQQRRAPILYSLVATSLRAEFPDWSIEKILKVTYAVPLSELMQAEAEGEDIPLPPAGGEEGSTSTSSDGESSPSSTPEDTSPSKTSSVIPLSSTNHGSPTTTRV